MRAMTDRRRAKIEKVLSRRQKDLTLVLDNIHDPHNVSAIYRSCDAFGVHKVHLYYTGTPFPHLSEKTSASARKWVDTVRHGSKESLIGELKNTGYQILATNCTPTAKPLREYDLTIPTAIIMGNEHSGVSEELFPLVDGEIYIPKLQCFRRRRPFARRGEQTAPAERHVRYQNLFRRRIPRTFGGLARTLIFQNSVSSSIPPAKK